MPANRHVSPSVVTGIGFSLIMMLLGAGYFSCWQQGRRLQAETVRCEQADAEVAHNAVRLVDLTRRTQMIEAEVRDYDRLVPDSKDLGSFLGQLSAELENAGLQNTAVRALASTLLGKCERLPIEVHGTGSFEQVHRFLERLESMPRKSSVSRLQLEADAAISGTVTLDITLSIYSTRQN